MDNQGPERECRPSKSIIHGVIPREFYVLSVGCARPAEYELCGLDVVSQSGLAHMSRERKHEIVAVVYRN